MANDASQWHSRFPNRQHCGYAACVARGQRVLSKLSAQECQPSSWTLPDLARLGFDVMSERSEHRSGSIGECNGAVGEYEDSECDKFLVSQGLPPSQKWMWWTAERIWTFTSRANVLMLCKPSHRAMLISEVESYLPPVIEPGTEASAADKKCPSVKDVPRTSDLIWIGWKHCCESEGIDPSKGSIVVIQRHVENAHSQAVMDQLWVNQPQPSGYRSTIVSPETDLEHFQAIVGSPNGIAAAHTILNRPELTGKTISTILQYEHPPPKGPDGEAMEDSDGDEVGEAKKFLVFKINPM